MATEEMFGRDGPAPPGTQVWVGGHLESAEALGQAFLEAADALAEVWRSGRRTASTDRLALPIIQTYRHAIELMLKAGCEKTAQLIGFGQELGYGQETRPADLEDKLGSTHSIARLVTLLNDLLNAGDGAEGEGQEKERRALGVAEVGMCGVHVGSPGWGERSRWCRHGHRRRMVSRVVLPGSGACCCLSRLHGQGLPNGQPGTTPAGLDVEEAKVGLRCVRSPGDALWAAEAVQRVCARPW